VRVPRPVPTRRLPSLPRSRSPGARPSFRWRATTTDIAERTRALARVTERWTRSDRGRSPSTGSAHRDARGQAMRSISSSNAANRGAGAARWPRPSGPSAPQPGQRAPGPCWPPCLLEQGDMAAASALITPMYSSGCEQVPTFGVARSCRRSPTSDLNRAALALARKTIDRFSQGKGKGRKESEDIPQPIRVPARQPAGQSPTADTVRVGGVLTLVPDRRGPRADRGGS